MTFEDKDKQIIYITESINAHELMVMLMRVGGVDWKHWKIESFHDSVELDGDYEVAPDAMVNQLELFRKLRNN